MFLQIGCAPPTLFSHRTLNRGLHFWVILLIVFPYIGVFIY